MSDADEKLRALAEAATVGPWTWKNADVLDGEARALAVVSDWDDPEQQDWDAEFIAAANPAVVLSLLDRLAAVEAENERLMADRAKAGRAIYEAQRPAFALLESSGAPKVENRERTPMQAALVELYSLVHNAAKLLVGRLDIEHNDLADANARASEWRMEYATVRAELDQARQALQRAQDARDSILADVNQHAVTHPKDQRFRDGAMHAWAKLLDVSRTLAGPSGVPAEPDEPRCPKDGGTFEEHYDRGLEAGRAESGPPEPGVEAFPRFRVIRGDLTTYGHTSDEAKARASVVPGDRLQQLHVWHQRTWQVIDSAPVAEPLVADPPERRERVCDWCKHLPDCDGSLTRAYLSGDEPGATMPCPVAAADLPIPEETQ